MKCQKCGAELKKGVSFCRECGARVLEQVTFCSNCGSKIEDGANFCPNCGKPVSFDNADRCSNKRYRSKKIDVTDILNELKKNEASSTSKKEKVFDESCGYLVVAVVAVLFILIAIIILAGIVSTDKDGFDTEVNTAQLQNSEYNTEEDTSVGIPSDTSYFEEESNTENEKKEKNGFDEKSNSVITIGKFKFSIPSYWDMKTNQDDFYEAYAELSDEAAVLVIEAWYDEDDPVTYDILEKEDKEGKMIESVESYFDSCSGTTSEPYGNGTINGYIYKTSFVSDDDFNGKATYFIFPSESDNKWVTMWLIETDNTEYAYNNDFKKIINSITKISSDHKKMAKGKSTIPAMSETSIDKIVDRANDLGLEEVYDEDFGHGTRMKSMMDRDGLITVDIVYVEKTKEIMYTSIVANNQKSTIKKMSSLLCPKKDKKDVKEWVNINIGSSAQTKIGNFTYDLEIGTSNSILFSAGEPEWEAWESKQ